MLLARVLVPLMSSSHRLLRDSRLGGRVPLIPVGIGKSRDVIYVMCLPVCGGSHDELRILR